MIAVRPGDTIVYRPSNWIGRLIALKTWHNWSHVEMIVNDHKAIGARMEGVNYYPINLAHAGMVIQPPPSFNLQAALDWFDDKACGQAYDLFGLFRFFTWGKPSLDKQFCSELLTRAYRAGGVDIFAGQDADLVPPGWFATLAGGYGFTTVWKDEG